MSRVSLPSIVSGYLAADKLNEALMVIAEALDRALFRDGAAPNAMQADLDMGGHQILNLSFSQDNPDSIATLEQVKDYVDLKASDILVQRSERQIATAAQTVFNLTTMTYQPGSHNLAVYVNGVRKFATFDFVENDADTVTFLAGQTVGDKVDFVSTEFLATTNSTDHTHSWSQITNAPVYTTRWPQWTEVTGKPTTFAPSAHTHAAADITSGRLADARRGVFVQSTQPTGLGAGDAGVLWFW